MSGVEIAYMVSPAWIAPSILSVVALVSGLAVTWWALAALPFIWLGSLCAAPNMNLADGCLVYLSFIAGAVIWAFFKPLGMAILFGAVTGYFASAVEKCVRMKPIQDDV